MTKNVTLLFLLISLIIFVFADFFLFVKAEIFKNDIGVVKKNYQTDVADSEEDEHDSLSEKKMSECESLNNQLYLYTYFHTQLLVACEINATEKLQIIHFDIESPPPETLIFSFI